MNFNRIRRKISLDGKVAIVTGASRPNGQGRATARALAARGASILVTDIPEQVPEMTEGVGGGGMGSSSLLLETVEELKAMGAQAACFPANLAKKEDIRKITEAAVGIFGGIDILVNNAAVFCGSKPLADLRERDLELTYQINFKAVVELCKSVIPFMRDRGGGSIINNSSGTALVTTPCLFYYGVSKAFLLGLTKSLAADYGKYNIRTNAIVTGNILTDAMRNEIAYYSKRDGTSFEDSLAELKAGTVLNEIGRPEDTAETMAFLASPAAAFFNGCFFAVDGGDTCGTVY